MSKGIGQQNNAKSLINISVALKATMGTNICNLVSINAGRQLKDLSQYMVLEIKNVMSEQYMAT